MSASTSYKKIKNWLLICFALVDIIENHKRVIYDNKDIDLKLIIETCYPKKCDKLTKYIEERKNKFLDEKDNKIELSDYQENEVDNDFKMKSL